LKNKKIDMIKVSEVISNNDYNNFVKLPYNLYKNNEFWIPPIINEELKSLKPKYNPAFDFCEAKFFIAFHNNKCVGRIAAIINHKHNEILGKIIGRIGKIEFINNTEVTDKLFNAAETWLKEKGVESVHGPLGFTNLDNQGLLIEGFDHLPSMASVYHFPYYAEHFERLGYIKENDWIEFRLFLADEIPEKASRLADMIQKRYKLKIISFKTNKELASWGNKIFTLLNQSFTELPYVSPFTDKMIDYYSKKYFSLLNPKFAKVILTENNEMAGFIIGIPSLSLAMQKAKGKLLPFGFMHIMKALKKPKVVDLLLTGVPPHLQGLGVPALLINELQNVIIKHNVKVVETTGIFETNQKAIVTWKNYEHIQHKRRRCYIKKLV